jgi:endonuclease/exonuclease/phosphatase (EEP) superfamily protein YafD
LLWVASLLLAGCSARPPRPAAAPDASEAEPPADAGFVDSPQLRVATFNVHRFFDTVCQSGSCAPGDYEEQPTQAEFDAKADLLAATIREFGAHVVVLQEIETQACLDALAARLSDVLPASALAETGPAASVDVAVMASAPITQTVSHRDRVLTRPDGTTTVFSRDLFEVHLALAGRPVVAFAAHFRSKANDDPGRRLAEAQAAHELVVAAALAQPGALVVFGGDLNDVPGSPPLQALEADAQLLRVASDRPVAAQATYVYGGVGEAIDHLFLATGGAGAYVAGSARVLHMNSGSDHDPLVADFRLPP